MSASFYRDPNETGRGVHLTFSFRPEWKPGLNTRIANENRIALGNIEAPIPWTNNGRHSTQIFVLNVLFVTKFVLFGTKIDGQNMSASFYRNMNEHEKPASMTKFWWNKFVSGDIDVPIQRTNNDGHSTHIKNYCVVFRTFTRQMFNSQLRHNKNTRHLITPWYNTTRINKFVTHNTT